jgi:hypothetical protein
MLKKLALLSVMLLSSAAGLYAQDAPAAKDSFVYKTVLIVTFNPKFYMSDIDREILAASDMEFRDLLNFYRNELVVNLRARLARQYNATGMRMRSENDTIDDFSYAYSCINYLYEPLPVPKEKPKSAARALFGKKEQENADVPGTGIRDGQLQTAVSSTPKYMASSVRKKELLDYLSGKYNADYLLLINQFETRIDVSDPAALSAGEAQRLIKVHFTFLDRSGTRVCSNMVQEPLSREMNNVHELAKSKFPLLAEKITACLPEGIILKITPNSK